MKCYKCGKEDGNYEIWIEPNGCDPPVCYCSRRTEEGKLMRRPPCHGCYPSVTMYPCKECGSR